MSFLFKRRAAVQPEHGAAERLHDDLVALIRQPRFYLADGVPDTFEGRFDLLVLHVATVLRRLRGTGPAGDAVAQHLVDTLFARFEVAMRELGVSDIGVPKRMKRLAQAFRGRTTAYHAALDADDEAALTTAIARNVVGPNGAAAALARHIEEFDKALAAVNLVTYVRGLPASSNAAELP